MPADIRPKAPLQLRERSKVERKANILRAARMLFTELGYEATTLNQIAALAGLGKGTIFNYVTDKRDLIFLIFHEEMSSVIERSLAQTQTKVDFSEKILSIAELPRRRRSTYRGLTQAALDAEGLHQDKFLELRGRLIAGMGQIVTVAQQDGVLSTEETPGFIASQLFFAFSSAIREWLRTRDPEWRAGMRQFRRILKLLLAGIAKH